MLYWNSVVGLIAIGLAYSSEISLEHTVIEFFNSQDYQVRGKADKVNVSLYYETRCPNCVDFYTDVFNKTVAKLAAYINVKTYPYGNAKTTQENGKTVIECQHGPQECYGNKLHACAIDILNNSSRSVFYNSCMMTGISSDKDATRCGDLMGIDAKPIIECANSKKGDDLLEYYGKETVKDCPDKAGVPWKLINGKAYIYSDNHFIRAICGHLNHPPPESKRLVEVTGDRRAGGFLAERISIAIQRGNAAIILGTLPQGPILDFNL